MSRCCDPSSGRAEASIWTSTIRSCPRFGTMREWVLSLVCICAQSRENGRGPDPGEHPAQPPADATLPTLIGNAVVLEGNDARWVGGVRPTRGIVQ